MPNPKPLVAAVEGTLRNQPRLATWFRTDFCIAWWAAVRLPCFDRSSTAPGGRPPNSSVSSTISCGAVARLGSTRVTWKSFLPSLCTVSAPLTARSMMVAAVSRVSTCPSISSPASATGIRGGVNATGMGRSGSLGTTGAC